MEHGGATVTGSAPSRLRQLLVTHGVGTEWGYRELARRSSQGGRRGLSRDTWRRLCAPVPAGQRGHRWDHDDLQIVSDTLTRLGVRISIEALERAVLADLGYETAVTGDVLTEVMQRVSELTDDERLRLARTLLDMAVSPQDGQG